MPYRAQAIVLAQANGLTAADILPQAAENMTGENVTGMSGFHSFYAARADAGVDTAPAGRPGRRGGPVRARHGRRTHGGQRLPVWWN
ncbi:hypothetical protein ACIHCQ_01700 [Streptomyces sp. NPDC052236]|uniref:hypothetical protein n=1 Tax=Streptomyces sp. NPDC052236 TaxID=3365686 RepID=UPI0037D7E64B